MNRIDTTEILDVHGLSRVLVVADDPLVREGLLLRLGLVTSAGRMVPKGFPRTGRFG